MGRKEPSLIYLPDCHVSRSVPPGCVHTHDSKDDTNRITRDHWSRLVSPLQDHFSPTDDDSDGAGACKKDANPGFAEKLPDSPSPSSGSSSSAKSSHHEGGHGQDNVSTSGACQAEHNHDVSHDCTQHKACPHCQPRCRCREESNNATLKAKQRRACLNRGVNKRPNRAHAWERCVLNGEEAQWNTMPKCPKIDNLILVEPETVADFDLVKKAQLRRDVSDCLKEEMLRAKACVEREANRYRSYFNYKGKEIQLDPRSRGRVEKVDHRNENYLNRLDDILKKKCIVEEDEQTTPSGKHVMAERHGCALNRRRSHSSGKQRKKCYGKSKHQLMNFPRSDKLSVFERLYQDAKHIKYANREKDNGAVNREIKCKRHVCGRVDMGGIPFSHRRSGASSPHSCHHINQGAKDPRGSFSFNAFKHDEGDVDGKRRRFTEKQLEFLENLPEDFTVQESKSLIKAIVSIIQRRFSNESKQKDNGIEPKHHGGARDFSKENDPDMGRASEKQSAPKIIYSTRASDVAKSVFHGGPLKASASGQFSKSNYTEPNDIILDDLAASHKTSGHVTNSGKVPSDTCLSSRALRVDRYNLREEIDNIVRPKQSRLDTMPSSKYGSSLAPSRVLLDSSPTFKYRDLLTSGAPLPKTRAKDGIRNFAFDNDDTTVGSLKFPFKTSLTTRTPFSFELDAPLTSNNESYNRSPPFPPVFSSKYSRLRTRSETLIKTNPYLDIDPQASFFNPIPHDDTLMDYTTVPKSSAFIKDRTFLGNFSGGAKSSFLRMMEDNRPQKCWLDKVNEEQQKFADISKGLDRCTFPRTGTNCYDEIRGSDTFHLPDYGVSPKPCPHDVTSIVSRYGGDVFAKRETRGLHHDLPSDSFRVARQSRHRPALQGVTVSDTLREACLENIASLKSFNSSLVNEGTKKRFFISNSLDRDSGEFERDSSKFDLESFKRARRKRDRFDSSTTPIDSMWGPKLGVHGDLDDLDALSCSADTIDTANTSMTARLTEINQRFHNSSIDDWKNRYSKEINTPNMTEHSAEKLMTNLDGKLNKEFITRVEPRVELRVEPSPEIIEISAHKTPSAPAVELFESASTQTSETSPAHCFPRTTDDANLEPLAVKKNSSTQANPAKDKSPNSSQTSDSSCTTPSMLQSQAVGSKPIPVVGESFKGPFLTGKCPDIPAHSLLDADKPDLGKALAILENFSPIRPVDIHTKYPLLLSRRLASQPNDSGTSDDNSTWTGVSGSSSPLYKAPSKDRHRSHINHQASPRDDNRSQPNEIRTNCPVPDVEPQMSSKKANDWSELGTLHGLSALQSTDSLDEMLAHFGSRRAFHRETLHQDDPMEKLPQESQKQCGLNGVGDVSVSSNSASCHRNNDKMEPSAETIISRIMKSRRDQFGISLAHAPTGNKSSDDIESSKTLLDSGHDNPNSSLNRTLDSDTSSDRPASLAATQQQDSSMKREVKISPDVIQQNSVKQSHASFQVSGDNVRLDNAPEVKTGAIANDGIRPGGSSDSLTESGTGHDEIVRHAPTTLTASNKGIHHIKESLPTLKSSSVKVMSDQLDSAISRHIENRTPKSTSAKIMVIDLKRTKSAKNASSFSKTNLKCMNSIKPDVYKPPMGSEIAAVRSCQAKPRDTHVKSGSYNANCLEDLKHEKDIVVIDVISEPPGTPEPVTVKAYTVNSGVPVNVKSYQTRISSPRFVVRTLDSKASVCDNSCRKSAPGKGMSGSQNTRLKNAPALRSVQFNCPQDNRNVGVKLAPQSYTICANNNSKTPLHSGSDHIRSDLVCSSRRRVEASGSDSSVTCSDHLTDDTHDTSSKDEDDETSEVSNDDGGDHNNCNMYYLCNNNIITSDSLVCTIGLYQLMYDCAKSRPSLKLLGELAFQLERRILDYVFGMEDSKRRRFYGYTVSNIFSMMERETKFPKGGSDVITKSELAGRLKKLLQALERYGYNIKTHGEFAQEMVNKYGLLACPPDESTIAQFGLTDPNAIAHLIQQLAQGPSEISSLTVLLNSLKYLSKCDQRPLFIW